MSRSDDLLVTKWRDIGVVAWAESDHGWLDAGNPITLEAWQRAIASAWWEQRETVTTLAISNIKKTGKTFINAVILCWRWLALPGEHFAVGNDLDQSAGRQFAMIREMVKRHPYLKQHCKVDRTSITFLPTGSTITALAGDAAGNAGANHLTASHTEAWGIIYEGSIRAYEELTPPPGVFYGLPALRVCDSYAGWVGESDTWHNLVDRGVQGDRVSDDWAIYLAGSVLIFHAEGEEAQERCFRGAQEQAKKYYDDQRAQLRPNAFSRLHLNRRTSSEAVFVTDEQWQACRSDDVIPLAVGNDKRKIVLGADASTSRDLTALVGCTANGTRIEQVLCRVWKPERSELREGKPTVDLEQTIGEEVLRLHKAGHVLAVYADNYQLHSLIITWQRAGVKVIELPQNAGRVESDQSLYDAIIGRTLSHYGDPILSEHIRNSVAIETPRGLRLAKEKTSKKIDSAVALSMSHFGALEMIRRKAATLKTSPNPFYGEGREKLPPGTTFGAKGNKLWSKIH